MSLGLDNAKAFLTVFTAKPTVRMQLYVLSPKTIDDFIRFAHAKTGYSFSKADLQTALREFNTSSTNELKQRYSL